MFKKINPFKKKQKPEKIELTTEKFQMTISDNLTISNVIYKNTLMIESLELADLEPQSLGERFNEAFYELKSENFNQTKAKKFNLSTEKGFTSTRVFINGSVENKNARLDITVIVKVDKKGVFIEIKAKSNLKIYWGLSALIKMANGSMVEEKEEKEIEKHKKYEYAPRKAFMISNENKKLLLSTTYGSSKDEEEKFIILQPSLEGKDREVINSWRINSDLRNYNVISITESI